MYYHIKKALYLLATLFIFSCLDNVKHENPLDPHNKNSGLTINGVVSTFYPPVQPIGNAVISLHPGDIKIFSDINGAFSLEELEKGEYKIFAEAEGYSVDSIQISLTENTKIDFFLDGLPYFDKINLTTHHTSRFFPIDDMFFLQLNVIVNDPDGIADINKVYFEIPEISLSDTLLSSLQAGIFNLLLSVEDLHVNTIHTLIGRELVLGVSDDAGFTVLSQPQFLTRIIDITPVVKAPTNLETVTGDSILFSWEKILLPFWFSHKIEIYQINFGLLTKIMEVNDIGRTTVSRSIKNTLTPADYVWILTVTDEFGNTSSSKEGTFHISN